MLCICFFLFWLSNFSNKCLFFLVWVEGLKKGDRNVPVWRRLWGGGGREDGGDVTGTTGDCDG